MCRGTIYRTFPPNNIKGSAHSRPKHVFIRVYRRIGFSVRSTATRRFAKADLIKPSGLRHAGRCLLGMHSAPPRVINKDIIIGSPRDLQRPDDARNILTTNSEFNSRSARSSLTGAGSVSAGGKAYQSDKYSRRWINYQDHPHQCLGSWNLPTVHIALSLRYRFLRYGRKGEGVESILLCYYTPTTT